MLRCGRRLVFVRVVEQLDRVPVAARAGARPAGGAPGARGRGVAVNEPLGRAAALADDLHVAIKEEVELLCKCSTAATATRLILVLRGAQVDRDERVVGVATVAAAATGAGAAASAAAVAAGGGGSGR